MYTSKHIKMKLSKKQKQELWGKIFSLMFSLSITIGLLWFLISNAGKASEIKEQRLKDKKENLPWQEDFENVDSVNFIVR